MLSDVLGFGVEKAARITFIKAVSMLENRETISDSVMLNEKPDSFAVYEVLPIQELEKWDGKCIEFRILASDGERELEAYYYVKS